MKKILLVGGFGYQNVGDEAQLANVIKNFRRHYQGCKITVSSPNPKYTSSIHDCDAVTYASRTVFFFQNIFPKLYGFKKERKGASLLRRLGNLALKVGFILRFISIVSIAYLFKKTGIYFGVSAKGRTLIQEIRNADILHFTGGGYLTEDTISRLWDAYLLILLSKIFNTKVSASGQTIGKIRGKIPQVFARYFFSQITILSTRDYPESIDNLSELNPRNVIFSYVADDALLISGGGFRSLGANQQKKIALHIHFWGADKKEQKQILEFYLRLYGYLVDEGLYVCLVSMHPSDEVAIARFTSLIKEAHLREPSFVHVRYDYHETIAFFNDVDLCITMKHHPIIFSFSSGTPVISLNFSAYYQHKNSGAMKAFEMEEFSISLSDFNFQLLCAKIDTMRQCHEDIATKIGFNLNLARARDKAYWIEHKSLLGSK